MKKKRMETSTKNRIIKKAQAAADNLVVKIITINKEFTYLEAEYDGSDLEPDYDTLRFDLATIFANLLLKRLKE